MTGFFRKLKQKEVEKAGGKYPGMRRIGYRDG